jgi:Protein of unknown function (DUF1703)./Predicted AAA-ATPase.
MSERELPLINTSNSSFRALRENNAIYVDKTDYLHSLIAVDGQYFLSRPRRFGKSLTLSTLEAIFKGERELFKGLKIDALDYDWKPYPVIHIDFGLCSSQNANALNIWLTDQLNRIAGDYSVAFNLQSKEPAALFDYLIAKLGKVVVLVDEYDKVLSDNIDNPNAEELRSALGSFFQVIKADSKHVRFCLITGVTRYAKMSVFSQMNNLKDISMNREFACLLGYTQEELEHYFDTYIDEGCKQTALSKAEYLSRVKQVYNGSRFFPSSPSLYNPVSVGSFFADGGLDFNFYWASTGTTKLLIDIAKHVDFNILDLDNLCLDKEDMANFDVLRFSPSSPDYDTLNASMLIELLYQTGYLTLKAGNSNTLLEFEFPNDEVRTSFASSLYSGIYRELAPMEKTVRALALTAFSKGDTKKAVDSLSSLFAAIPYSLTAPNEYSFQACAYTMLLTMGAKRIVAEEQTNNGRIDLVLEEDKHLYIIEFKFEKDGKTALAQIKTNRYHEKYLPLREWKTIHLLGINFAEQSRNIDTWEEEIIQ